MSVRDFIIQWPQQNVTCGKAQRSVDQDVAKLEYELRRNHLLIGIGVSVAPETSGSPGFRRAARTIHWPVRDQRLNRNEGQLLNHRGGTSLAKTIRGGAISMLG